METTKIDIVYTWVDGADATWARRKNQALAQAEVALDAEDLEYTDNNELLYSLRSIEKFCPWVNHVYIITDGQRPSWLQKNHAGISIVDHTELFEDHELPTYNSKSLELRMHRIEGLAEKFIYFNDDMLIGRAIGPDFFFDAQGRARLFVSRRAMSSKNRRLLSAEKLGCKGPYEYGILNARKWVYNKYDFEGRSMPLHSCKPYNRSVLAVLERELVAGGYTLEGRTFRSLNDIQIGAVYLYSQESLGIKPTVIPRYTYRPFLAWIQKYLSPKKHDFIYFDFTYSQQKVEGRIKVAQRYQPALFCVNESLGESEERAKLCAHFLHTLFPLKSSFEK